jgi:single-strand DNA-binding protein
MSGINKVILVGRLTRDPESKDASGTAICNFGLATSEEWKDKDGNKQEKAEFHNIVTFRKLAEICGKHLAKGKQVYVEGKIQTRSWDTESGEKKYKTEIVADSVQFLGSNTNQQESQESF